MANTLYIRYFKGLELQAGLVATWVPRHVILMITSLATALSRVTLFWYVLGMLILFLGDPGWAERAYARLSLYPFVPDFEMTGLTSAAKVQGHLLMYWTIPVLVVWVVSLLTGIVLSEIRCRASLKKQVVTLEPSGNFWGVVVPHYSLGALPTATTPDLQGDPVKFTGADAINPENRVSWRKRMRSATPIHVQGVMQRAVQFLTPAERAVCEELIQLLLGAPDHFAGLGHGVGLLEHTLNVAAEAAAKCTEEFRLPLMAALAHDVGKLVTFQPDGKGGWVRKGLHSRESGRILATLPAFQELPELHQRALLLAVKYDHAPSKMPVLRGERDATQLAMRIISALSAADKSATAAEKERHLERIQPEDLLWQDFITFLREAPVVQRGKKGAANQVNNPPDSPYLFIYEAPWRDEAVRRLPPEVAAALDLTRRDPGRMAKYTRILVSRLRKEGLLLESFGEHQVSEENPLWDIQSGVGEKAVVLRGIIVLHADALWKLVNYRLSIKSPFPVQILAPNADVDGTVRNAPSANRELPPMPDVSDGLKVDAEAAGSLDFLGLVDDPSPDAVQQQVSKPKAKKRAFKDESRASQGDAMFGLTDAPSATKEKKATTPEVAEVSSDTGEAPVAEDAMLDAQQADEMALAMAALHAESDDLSGDGPQVPDENHSLETALSLLEVLAPAVEPEALAVLNAAEASVSDTDLEEKAEPGEAPVLELTSGTEVESSSQAETSEKGVSMAHQAVDGLPAAGTDPLVRLSRAESREGLAIADTLACQQYPWLSPGDKYYPATSRAVETGRATAGQPYQAGKGDARNAGQEHKKTAAQKENSVPAARPASEVTPKKTTPTEEAVGLSSTAKTGNKRPRRKF